MTYRTKLRGERPKAFWGALVGGAMNLISSAISSKAQAKAIQRQIDAQREAAQTQLELANQSNLASTLNSYANATRSYNNEDSYGLKYRLGGRKRLGSDRIVITDGGEGKKIAPNTFLLQGGSHEDINESGNTGIGINVGGHEIEAEGGEVAQKKNGALRIFSAQPMLGGVSPAQAVLRGANKDKVFNAQQRFKRDNGITNETDKAGFGDWFTGLFSTPQPKKNTVHFYKSQATGKVFKTRKEAIAENNKYKTDLGYRRRINRDREFEAAKRKQESEMIPYIKSKEITLTKAGKLTGIKLSTNQLDSIAKYANKTGLPLKTALGLVGQETAFGNYFGYANNASMLKTYHTGTIDGSRLYSIPAYRLANYERLVPDKIPTAVDDHAVFNKYAKHAPADQFGYRKPINLDEVEQQYIKHEAYPGLQRKRQQFWKDIKTPYLQLAFEAYKNHPELYNAGNSNQQRLVESKANDAWGSPEIQAWMRTSSYVKHRLDGRIEFAGGGWTAPIYNTKSYRVSPRMRKQIAAWEGSDFAGQNRAFKGDAIGAKERELRKMMGRTYNYLNDNQRDSLNSIYYNSRVDTFKRAFGKWFDNLNRAAASGDERAFNNSLAGIRQSMTVGANRKGMSGLAKRRAWEQNWFGNPIPMDSQETKEALAREAAARMTVPVDNTRVVYQPQYIEVPAPVGHGIVPVDNPDPNLLQGNIKDNVIKMGNKFKLNQRFGGRTRLRCGGSIRPVKGVRSKAAFGDVVYPYRRNNDFDYWTAIAQEQNANDKGGVAPWQTSNVYDVKVPNRITSTTPTIPYTPSQVVSSNSGNVSTNNNIPYFGNKSGMILRDADWYGLGADLVSSIGGNLIGLGAYNKLNFDYNLPNFVEETPVALNTTYHNEAQKSNVERNRLNSRNSILRNTMSGSTALGRMQSSDTNAMYQLNQLADDKTNKETELRNQNLLNEQQVRARNAAAKNQYYTTVAGIKNAALQAKNEATLAKGQLLSGTLQGIGNSFQNLINQGRQNYDDTQAMLMGVAASDYATPSRLLELGVDVGDDAALAGIYRSAMNIPNPGARPKREDYSDNTEYSYALTRWENQNKAYQRRNSYADLIKGRMSRNSLRKYGII